MLGGIPKELSKFNFLNKFPKPVKGKCDPGRTTGGALISVR